MANHKVLHGADAVAAVTELVGRELTLIERRIVEEEGYVAGDYLDSKGISTSGVGQTGDFKGMSFEDTVQAHIERARGRIPALDSLPEELQAELVQAEYRGDLGTSPKFVKLINDGEFEKAAEEFLDNQDYRNSQLDGSGVAGRMERVSAAVRDYAPVAGMSEREQYLARGEQVPYDPNDRGEMKQGFRHEFDLTPTQAPLAKASEVEGLTASIDPSVAQQAAPTPEAVPTPAPEQPAPEAPPAPPGILTVPEVNPRQPSYDQLYTAQVEGEKRSRDIGWFELMAAGVRNDNSLGVFAMALDHDYVPDYSFDIQESLKEAQERVDALGGDQEEIGEILGRAVSADHFDSLLGRLERVDADEKMFAEAGLKGLAARLPGMLFDPIDIAAAALAAPIGGGVKLTKLGAAVKAALAAGVSNATIEAYAALDNPYRNGNDVALAGLAGLFMGGAIGGLTAKSNRELRDFADKVLKQDLEDATALTIARNLANDGNVSAAKRVLGSGEEVDEARLAPKAHETAEEIVAKLPDQKFAYKWVNTLQRNLIGRTFYSTNDTIRRTAASIMEGGLLVDKKATRAATAEGRMNQIFQTTTASFYRSTRDDFVKWAERNEYSGARRELGIEANERFYTDVGVALKGGEASPEAAAAAAKVRPLLDEIAKVAREVGIPGFENPLENFFPRYWDDVKLTNLSQEVSRETQGLWFKQALLKRWDEVNPRPDTTELELDLGDARAELVRLRDNDVEVAEKTLVVMQERMAKAVAAEQEAAYYFSTFRPRQKGIGEARRMVNDAKAESMAARRALTDAEKEIARTTRARDLELAQHDAAAMERIKFANARIPESTRQELENLRNEIEGLRQAAEGTPGTSPERIDLRRAQKQLHDLEEIVNRKIKRAEDREVTAERIGQAFARAIHRRNLGINDAMQRGIPLDDMDRLRELFDGTGLKDSDLDDLVAQLQTLKNNAADDAGNVRHGRHRLHFDENLEIEVATKDGGKRMLSLNDMTEGDASKVLPRYFRTMGGWIGLAKESGIRGQRDINAILTKAAEDGADHDELTALRDAFKLVTGRTVEEDPSGLGSQSSRLLTAWNYPRFGGSFGVAQLPEIGNIVGEIGFINMLRDIPDMAKLVRQAADGTLDDATAREIEELIAPGTDYLIRPPQKNFSVEDGVKLGDVASKIDAGAARAGRLTAITSLMAPINAMLERFATRGIMRDWGRLAKTGASVPEWKAARLRGAGLSDEMRERVFKQLREKGNYNGDVLVEAKPHTWDDLEAADAYRMSLDRERRQTVQRNDIGNTGVYIHKPLGRVMTQFMNFMLNSINKQLVRGVHYRDIQTFVSWGSSMFLGGLAYTAQTSIDYANDPEKRKERLEPKRIAAAAYQRAGFSAITVPLVDSALTLAGIDPIFKFGRTSGLGTDFITGNPSFSTATDVLYTAALPVRWAVNGDYRFSQQDSQRLQRLIPLQRTLGIKNAFHALEDNLPARSTPQ